MITYEDIIKSQETIVDNWGESGKKVIEECIHAKPFNGSFDEFLSHCTMCGGNWGGMLLTGIKDVAPQVWDAIPDDMGVFAFNTICATLILLAVTPVE